MSEARLAQDSKSRVYAPTMFFHMGSQPPWKIAVSDRHLHRRLNEANFNVILEHALHYR